MLKIDQVKKIDTDSYEVIVISPRNYFLTEDLRKWYPVLTNEVRITLVEAAKGILNTFDKKLSRYAMKNFQRQRIEVRTGSAVKEVQASKIISR
jgi:NADH:ubiquinone reductase (non-electrogenic)